MDMVPMQFVYRFGEFEADAQRFQLRRNGIPLVVEHKPLHIILYLAAHSERLVSKQELLENLWDRPRVSDAVLRQAIAGARCALGDPQGFIQTVRGIGFRFMVDVTVQQMTPGFREKAGAYTVPETGELRCEGAALAMYCTAALGQPPSSSVCRGTALGSQKDT